MTWSRSMNTHTHTKSEKNRSQCAWTQHEILVRYMQTLEFSMLYMVIAFIFVFKFALKTTERRRKKNRMHDISARKERKISAATLFSSRMLVCLATFIWVFFAIFLFLEWLISIKTHGWLVNNHNFTSYFIQFVIEIEYDSLLVLYSLVMIPFPLNLNRSGFLFALRVCNKFKQTLKFV